MQSDGKYFCWQLLIGVIAFGCLGHFSAQAANVTRPHGTVRIAVASSAADSGIMSWILKDFGQSRPDIKVDVMNVGAIEALDQARAGNADIVITHHRPSEDLFLREGYGGSRHILMYNDFAFFGPAETRLSLDLQREPDLRAALKRLAKNQPSFFAPNSRSGTALKLKELWDIAQVSPTWVGYEVDLGSAGNTLHNAARFNAFAFADMGSYFRLRKEIGKKMVPVVRDYEGLRNYYAIILVNGPKVIKSNLADAEELRDYLLSERGQARIAAFSQGAGGGNLFVPAAQLDEGLRAERAEKALRDKARHFNIVLVIAAMFLVTAAGAVWLWRRALTAENKLKVWNEDLEDHVALRTRQLAEVVEQLKHRTLLDPLTNLPNRVLLSDRLGQVIKTASKDQIVAVGFIDLNNFKAINDTYGHYAGDTVLKESGARMIRALPPTATVARLGGDEFSVFVVTSTKEEATELLRTLYSAVTTAVNAGGHICDVRASVGIAFFPEHGSSVEDIMRCADIAMYAAKRANGGVLVYDPSADDQTQSRKLLVADLRGAIDSEKVTLYYQPRYDYSTGEVSGVESFARWHHPTLGMVKPLTFLPIAKSLGLSNILTRHLIGIALRQAAEWRSKGIELTISVKIDDDSFSDPEFSHYLSGELARIGVPGHMLDLGVNESALVTNPPKALDALTELKRKGVSISIEDFGSGYSSIGWISNIVSPISRIKISRKNILEMPNNGQYVTYVHSLIQMAHALNFKVAAEGVENETTFDELKTLGCDEVHGYYLSRPVAPANLEQWYADRPKQNGHAPGRNNKP